MNVLVLPGGSLKLFALYSICMNLNLEESLIEFQTCTVFEEYINNNTRIPLRSTSTTSIKNIFSEGVQYEYKNSKQINFFLFYFA
jgi:hypothetical protein